MLWIIGVDQGRIEAQGCIGAGFTFWALADQYDLAIWAEWVPSKVNPAGLPASNRELPFETEPKEEMASVDELPPRGIFLGSLSTRNKEGYYNFRSWHF